MSDLKRLLTVVRLRHEEVVDVDAELAGISGIERMLRIDERRLPAQLLRFGDDVQRHRGLAARFGAKDFNDAAAGETANPQRGVNRQAPAGNYTNGHQNVPATQAHDGTLTVGLFDEQYCIRQRFLFFICHFTPRWRKVGKPARDPVTL